jgi:hypothetical protein
VCVRTVWVICVGGILLGRSPDNVRPQAVFFTPLPRANCRIWDHSWHPCDWLLVERVDLILRREGVDPDTASIPLKAVVAESAEVQAILQRRNTPTQCLVTWAW